jgi:hypothetical protein
MLPPELISLIHHVELNKAGWWDKAVQQFILSALWRSGEPMILQAILKSIRRDFKATIGQEKTQTQIKALCASGLVVSLPSDQFKVSESALRKFKKDLKEVETVEKGAKDKFIALLEQRCPSLDGDDTWHKFNELVLIPLIRNIGANTYQILSGIQLSFDKPYEIVFNHFIQDYPLDFHKQLGNVAKLFLDPKDMNVRSFIQRLLNAYFFIEASGLSEDTLESLTKLSELKPSFTIFVDTNFLFSILELHENPSNEAAVTLIELLKLITSADVRLYVLPPTVQEVKGVLLACQNDLSDMRLTSNLAESVLETGITGITRKFVEEVCKHGSSLSAKSYFNPYITNLKTISGSKGVEFFDENLDEYRINEDVCDDIQAQLRYEERRYGDRAKSYEQHEHDIVLWHFVHDRRPTIVESPLEANYWIVTVDYRFLGFDAFKRQKLKENLPICIHPTSLVHMLQFWVPRTPQFEEAMLSSMRLPFLFQEFDPKAEKVTIRILKTLSRFENVGDIPIDTAVSILLSDALRQRIASEPEIEKQIQLVKEELIEEHQKLKTELQETRGEKERLDTEIKEKVETVTTLDKTIKEEHEKRELLETKVQQLEEEIRIQKEEAKKQREEVERQRQVRKFAIKWAAGPIMLIGLAGGSIAFLLVILTRWPFWWTALSLWSLLLMLWLWIIDRQGLKDPTIKEWRPFNVLHKFKKWLWGSLVLLLYCALSGILGNACWEWFKKIWL